MKFAEGNRVLIKKGVGNNNLYNQCGTICFYESDNSVGVRFDNHIGGHDCDDHCDKGHGWFVPKSLLSPEIVTNWQEHMKKLKK